MNMLLFVHVCIALASMAMTSFLFIRPSKNRLRASYVLMGATLASGTYLVASTGSHLLQACTMGLLYSGAISVGIVSARRKLAAQKYHQSAS